MRALLQRVTRAEVRVEGKPAAAIGPGLVILLGIGPADDQAIGAALARRIAELRIFRDDDGRTTRSLLDGPRLTPGRIENAPRVQGVRIVGSQPEVSGRSCSMSAGSACRRAASWSGRPR